MSLDFAKIVYEDSHACVSWCGLSFDLGEELSAFLKNRVASRLNDSTGQDQFRNHLSGLALTGMGQTSLAAVLNADAPKSAHGQQVKRWPRLILQKHMA